MADRVLPPVRAVFRAMAEAFVPEARALDDAQWVRAESAVEASLASRPETVKRQLRLFLTVADWLPLLRYGARFRSLPAGRREAFLRTLERAPLLPVRRGVWGVRTLAFLACYGLPEVRRAIGYRAHPDGWDARRTSP